MLPLPIPMAVIYSGLVGVFIALIVATATNKWQFRVFVLLALRLAIGWHFLFEGLHKVHSTYVGPTETNRVFTSEPYFAAGEGPLADVLRKRFLGDPEAVYTPMLTQVETISVEEFAKLPPEKQAALCPPVVADDLTKTAQSLVEGYEKDAAATKEAAAKLPAGTDDEKKAKTEADGKAAVAEAKAKAVRNDGREMKITYARWVYGVDRRDAKVSMINGDVVLSGPERLHYLGLLKKEAEDFKTRQKEHLGHGNGTDLTRSKKVEADYRAAKTELAKDCEAFVLEIKKGVGYEAKDEVKPKPLERVDWMTRWGITAIGAGLLLGLFTRFWCVAGITFLVMTYLSHPTVPWLPLPPMTEGNPLFINKNLIEALGLLVVAAHPTGRWLGIDALIHRIIFGAKEEA